MIVFAFTDGYLRTQIMMHGPKIAKEPKEQDALASVLVATLNSGYTAGSLIGILIVSIV